MAKQFRDKNGALWIASFHGSAPVGGARVGPPPIEVGKMDIDYVKMEQHGTDRSLLATLRHGHLSAATDEELREALAQALSLREDS